MVFTVDYQLVRLNGDVVPRMATPRLVLRPMLESDVERYLSEAPKTGEADVLGGMPDRPAYEELCRHHAGEWRVSGMGYLVVAERASNDAIGHVQLRPIERATGARAAEITYSIDPPHRGRGYSVEAAAAMLLLAFEILGVDPVIAFVPMDNAASFAVALRLGFEKVGENLVHKSMMRRMLMTLARWQASPAASLSRI
ncbi:MAG: GNAT family N-acetyltransferase [Rhodospirillaceae bacterium]|nr:GNAT family N-acetyltransferase [Rhodospirillaceae bacterium]